MRGTEAIESVDILISDLQKLVSAVRLEADAATAEWRQLGRVGGQRDDHAAALLARLRRPLRDISILADDSEEQITAIMDDPFGHD